VGVAGPKRRIQERLDGFPGLTATIVDMLAAHDKIVTRLVWRGKHTGPYGGYRGHRKRVEITDFAVWRFEDGQVAEISTIQDQFVLLKQIGYLPDEVRAA
jgi:predicted ester cyclase